jgi:ZIP family zinc transporter
MDQLVLILGLSWFAGFAAFIGSVAARWEGSPDTIGKQELVHGIVALGGGILVAAVAFALAPTAISELGPLSITGTFCLGGVGFCLLDIRISKAGGSKAQFMAMLMDFFPEAISLGAVFGHNRDMGMLLAAFIAAQNLPEGFNSYREITASGVGSRRALAALFAVSFLGPLAACLGYFLLQDKPAWTAGIMSFAAGGILYLIFQDIAPQSRMERHWKPPLGAVLGFAIGMVGHQLIG